MENFYLTRINKALGYINSHLAEDIKVAQLAKAAHFSTYHFQRLYKSIKGETPYDTILRLRLEKSIFYLKHHPQKRIFEIASEVGFSSAENFSRQFKERFDHSPSQLRKQPELLNSRIYQESEENDFHLAYEESRKLTSITFEVEVQDLAPIDTGQIRAVFGADGSGLVEAYEQLMIWFEQSGESRTGSRRFGMSMDDPDVTPANFYRYDFAVAIEYEFKGEGLIEPVKIPGGLYAILHCQGDITKVAQAWDYLYKVWLPQSGYVPRHFPAIEEFLKGPEEIGWETFDILCKVPVEKIKQ